MAFIEQRATVEVTVPVTLTEKEARALEAMAVYGADAFLNTFPDKMGAHENGLRTLFGAATGPIRSILRRADKARAAFEGLAKENAPAAVPTIPGTAFGGGFYAGRIIIDGQKYALIAAPKAEGEHRSIAWAPDWHKATPGTQSLCDGMANSEAMNDAEHPAAQWCRALRISGHDDWYLPSRDELELLYRNLKPGIDENWTYANRAKAWGVEPGQYNGVDTSGNGHNAASVPPGESYTDTVPAQTTATAFQTGGAEAFERRWYWSSSEFGPDYAWVQGFGDGLQYSYAKNGSLHCRAVRKVLI